MVGSLHVKSSLLFLESSGDGTEVDGLDLGSFSNGLEVSNGLHGLSMCDFGVSHNSSLVLVDLVELDGKFLLDMSHFVVLSSESLLFLSENDGGVVLSFEDGGHLLSLDSEGGLELLESNSLLVSGVSNSLLLLRDLAVLHGVVHDMDGLLGSLDEFSLKLSGGVASVVFLLVNNSPVVNLLGHGNDSLLGELVSLNKLLPDGLKLGLLNNVEVESDGSVLELGAEHSDLSLSSLLGGLGGSVLVEFDLNLKIFLDLNHSSLSLSHLDEHLLLGVVSLVGLDNPVLGFLDQLHSSLDGSVLLGSGVLGFLDGEVVSDLGFLQLKVSLQKSSLSKLVLLFHLDEVSLHFVSVDNSLLHGGVSFSHVSSSNSGTLSVVDHEGMGFDGGHLSGLHFLKSDHLKLEGFEVFGVSNLSRFLGGNSEFSSLDNLVSPNVDNLLIVLHGDFGGLLSDELGLEGDLGGLSSLLKLGEGELVLKLSGKSQFVHTFSSLLTTDSLSVVVEGLFFSSLTELGFSGESLLGSDLDLEVSSHDSGSLGKSLNGEGSLSFSGILGLEGTTSQELSSSSSTNGSFLFGESVSSSLDSFQVSSVSLLSGNDSLGFSLVRKFLSLLSTDGVFLPDHHHGEIFSQLDNSLVSLLLLDLGNKLSLDLLALVDHEDLDGILHSGVHLDGELLLKSSSLDLEVPVMVGLVLESESSELLGDHLLEVDSSGLESVVDLLHGNGDLSEVNLGTMGLQLHGVHSSSSG